MKGNSKKLGRRFSSNAATFVAVILWLCPRYASVICIAPGGHIAIEDINALCCASSGISTPTVYQPDNGFNAQGTCRNCSDFFMTLNGREAVSISYDHDAASSIADECLGNPADTSLSRLRFSDLKYIDVPIPVSSAVPLRC